MYYSTEMKYSWVFIDDFRVIILELNYIVQKGQVIVLDYTAKVITIDYIAKAIVIDYIAKVIIFMITIAITRGLVHIIYVFRRSHYNAGGLFS